MLIFVRLLGCGAEKETTFSGATMGTTYHIKLVSGYFKRTFDLKEKIEKRLREINQSMSTYLPESEISRFNALQGTDEKMHISLDFLRVLKTGALIYDLTGGAWDATVAPLVNLWGFGSTAKTAAVPDEETVAKLLKEIGFRYIDLSDNGYIRKKKVPLSLDLASIAKGYAVDQISRLIQEEGVRDYLVEIGGEVYAAGLKKDQTRWRVGVNLPEKGARSDAVYDIVALKDMAMATSGDYRNYFEKDGRTYTHILDPRSGYPVRNGVVSVSVIADTCTLADGLATAVMVMGREDGLSLVERLSGVEALVVIRHRDNSLEAYASKGFHAYKESSLNAATAAGERWK